MKLKSIGIVVTLVLTMFMAAIESSIISLALPTIRKDLNAGTAVPLVFTVYFIALVVANPIVGELLTRFKILYIAVVGILLFGIGSFMSGMSETFIMLIISRALQGLGAGVMMSLTQIVPKLAFEIPLRCGCAGSHLRQRALPARRRQHAPRQRALHADPDRSSGRELRRFRASAQEVCRPAEQNP